MEAKYQHRHTAECTAWKGNELFGLTGEEDIITGEGSEGASMDWDQIRHATLKMQTPS